MTHLHNESSLALNFNVLKHHRDTILVETPYGRDIFFGFERSNKTKEQQ